MCQPWSFPSWLATGNLFSGRITGAMDTRTTGYKGFETLTRVHSKMRVKFQVEIPLAIEKKSEATLFPQIVHCQVADESRSHPVQSHCAQKSWGPNRPPCCKLPRPGSMPTQMPPTQSIVRVHSVLESSVLFNNICHKSILGHSFIPTTYSSRYR